MLIVVHVENSKDQAEDVSFELEAGGNLHRTLKFGYAEIENKANRTLNAYPVKWVCSTTDGSAWQC